MRGPLERRQNDSQWTCSENVVLIRAASNGNFPGEATIDDFSSHLPVYLNLPNLRAPWHSLRLVLDVGKCLLIVPRGLAHSR